MAEQLIIRIKLHHGQPDHGQKKPEQPQPDKEANSEDIKPLIAKIAAAIIAVVAIILTLLPGDKTAPSQQVSSQKPQTEITENNKAQIIKSNNSQNISQLNSGLNRVKPVTPVARKKLLPASKPTSTQEMAITKETAGTMEKAGTMQIEAVQAKLQQPEKSLYPNQNQSPAPDPSLNPANITGQFTSGIKRLKPIDDLGTQIKPIAGKFTRSIYYYTIIKNQKGKKLTHKWEQNGKQRASISSQITQNRQIMYSSKKITTNMTGEWKVSVIDEAGNILKVDRFNY